MKESKNVLVTVPVEGRYRQRLEEAAPGYVFRCLKPKEVTQADVDWAQILLGNVNPEFLHGAPGLRWVQTSSAGVEGYVDAGRLHADTLLTNATGAYGLAISEHMLAMLMELQKKLNLYRDAQKTGQWQAQGAVQSVYGSTVLVMGLGDIGGEFARRCKALGAYVIGMRRTRHGKPDFVDEICTEEELDSVLPRTDVVAVSLPGTDKTAGMLSRSRIDSMKPGAVLLNVGRGKIVDTEALCDALESGRLWGAGLDVTDPEPLPPEHRLWRIPSAVITPHISGYYHLRATYERVMDILIGNLDRFYRGEPLRNQVDRQEGYRLERLETHDA